MDREIHPTPRHLDEPLRILGQTVPQLISATIGMGIFVTCLSYLPGVISMSYRLAAALVLGALPYIAVTMAVYSGVSLRHVVRRVWRYSREAREYLPGRPTSGPHALVLYDRQAAEEDSYDE